MNTAAPAHPPAHTQDASDYVRSDAYAAERISAQEAMKGMRITEPHQHNRRRKSSEVDDAYGASRVDRHLASRAQSVREPSKPFLEKDLALKLASLDRRRSNAECTRAPVMTAAPTDAFNTPASPTAVLEPHCDRSNSNNDNANEHSSQSRQTQAPQGPSALQDNESHSEATQQQSFHNQKAPIPPSSSSENSATTATAPHQQQAPSSGRQSRLSNVSSSSKESYRRKYGDIQGYTYIGTIGQGNFGKVLLAENDITGEQVAVKILEKAQFKSEQQRLHATREARLMVTLRHPNIVDVKTVMEDDYRILIVMENLTGGELFDYISNKGSLDEREARRIFQQIVLAIHYCHENNVVHRDLKPENILLDSERNVRVADFGFGNNWHKDRHLTTYCGSPFYAAPEMVSGTPYIGPETDVWSLGVILYVLVCGRLPFDASDLPALFAQIKRGNYQKPREGSIDVCSLIHRMLTVDPKRRATLTDVLRSRWMRADGMESMVTALPALSTAPNTIRPTPVRPQHHHQQHHQPPPQARSTALGTHHPNTDISTTMALPTVNTGHNRHSYHPPGAHEMNHPQQGPPTSPHQHAYHSQHQQPLQTPVRGPRDSDDQMSDVSQSMTNSPTETMATISPSTPVGPVSRDDALLAATAAANGSYGGGAYQKRSAGGGGSGADEKHHHPYKYHYQHSRNNSSVTATGEAVMISVCPSNDALMDGFDSSSKKKRKALTKLRQFFRFETNKV